MNVFRIAQANIDALLNIDPSKFRIFSDQDNILIKEKERGQGTIAAGSTATITHNLGYVPFFLAWGQVGTTRYRAINYYEIQSGIWRAYADNTTLKIVNFSGNAYTGYKYYLFYDNVT